MVSKVQNNPKSEVLEKGLYRLSIPLILEQLLVFSLPMADIFFMGKISDHAAAATGSLTPVIILCMMFTNMMIVGGSCVAGQYIGNNRYDRGNSALFILCMTALAISLLETVVIFFGRSLLVTALGLPAGVREAALMYLTIIPFMLPPLALQRVYLTIINTYGHPRWNFISSAFMCLLNIALNSWVVFGLKAGIQGVAITSVSSAVIVLGLRLFFVHGLLQLRFPVRYAMQRFKKVATQIWDLSLPCIIEPFSFHLSMVTLNALTARLGVVPLAAKTYTYNIFQLGVVVSISMGMANQAMIAQLIGKKDFEAAGKQFLQSLRAGVLGSGLVVGILLLFNRPMMELFTDNPAILKLSFFLFCMSAITEIPRAINIMTGGTLRACGDAWFTTRISILLSWCISIPTAYWLTYKAGWGIAGILTAGLLDETMRAVMNLLRWRTGQWRQRSVT